MKKILFGSIMFFVCTTLFLSCNEVTSFDGENEMPKEIPRPVSDLGNVVPYSIKKENNGATIGLFPFARMFYLNVNNEQRQHYLQKLEYAHNEKKPVKVSVYENTNEISNVEDLSEEEMNSFLRSSKQEESHSTLRNSSLKYYIETDVDVYRLFDKIKQSKEIPFGYVTDGCWARAHKMAQIINASGYQCEKCWIFGSLGAASESKPNCCAKWGYHVAITVYTEVVMGMPPAVRRITRPWAIDPSLFDKPVGDYEWKKACLNKQCNPGAPDYYSYESYITRTTPSNVYYFYPGYRDYEYDDDYSDTNSKLKYYSGLGVPCP